MKRHLTNRQSELNDITLWHMFAVIVTGNGILTTINAAQRFNMFSAQSAAANGDKFLYRFYLTPGDYNLNMLYVRNSNCGILTLTVTDENGNDERENTQTDMYFASVQYNQSYLSSFSINREGVYRLVGEITGHTAPSSGYTCPITMFMLHKHLE